MKTAPVVEDAVCVPEHQIVQLAAAGELANAKLTFIQRCLVWLLITTLK